MTTHHGQQVRFYDDLIKGKIVAVDLISTTCQYACPLDTARLAQVQRLLGERMGRDVFFYSITIDPEHDTPAVLNAYAEKYADGDPIALALRAQYRQARMPNLALIDGDAFAVIDYLDEQSRAGHNASPETATSASASSAPASVELIAIVDAYVQIQRALHAETTDRTHDAARAIETEATKLGSAGEAILTSAGTFERAGDLKSARAAFGTLGDAIMTYVKAFGSSLGGRVTVGFCPMVQKYWLQKGDRVQNPFYGRHMPDCGRLLPN